MKCSIRGCPGVYEDKMIVHTVTRNDDIFVFEHVPAEVCSVCDYTPEQMKTFDECLIRR